MYIDADDYPSVPLSNTRIYWCDQTYKPIGPDGDIVDEDTCTMYRKCIRPALRAGPAIRAKGRAALAASE